MAEIDGGALSFQSVMDNDQLDEAIEETLRRIKGLSDGTVGAGKIMDDVFERLTKEGLLTKDVLSGMSSEVANALNSINTANNINKQSIDELENAYKDLEQAMNLSVANKDDSEVARIKEKQQAIQGEITTRRALISENEENEKIITQVIAKIDEQRKKMEENSNTHASMKQRIRELREEMMLLIDQGIDEQSEAYQRLKNELGRLIDIQSDVAQQGRILANDEGKFQGIITGLSGLAGGFSAVTGAVSLFSEENEDLQKVMSKVQSVMAITIGMQQVAQTLNKDSAFQLVTLNGLKQWWAGVVAKATVAEAAETAATIANTVAHEANTAASTANAASEVTNTVATDAQAIAATTGTAANIGLAGAFRLVGAAIKSIPVFGWIIAGISALIGLYSYFSNKAREVKKAQEELNQKIIESAAKHVGSIILLKNEFDSLGSNMQAKEKFIKDNAKVFDELGLSIRNVADAERLLSDPTHVNKFIQAQINKARATAIIETDSFKKALKSYTEIKDKIEKAKATKEAIRKTNSPHADTYMYNKDIEISEYEKQLKPFNDVLEDAYSSSIKATQAYNTQMEDLNKESNNKLKGTIAGKRIAIGDEIQRLEAMREKLSENDKKGLFSINKKIEKKRNELEKLDGKEEHSSKSTKKDSFLEKLAKQKAEYDRFNNWVNSNDKTLAKAANTEFKGLLKQGATYLEYLKKQRDSLLAIGENKLSKVQNDNLRTINNQIAEETKKTVLEEFNNELSEQLGNAKNTLEMLNVIEQKRKLLENDGTELDNNKKDALDTAEKNAFKQMQKELDDAKKQYTDYLDSKIKADIKYHDERKKLEDALAKETNPNKKKAIEQQIQILDVNENTRQSKEYDDLVADYKNYEQRIADIALDYDTKIAIAKKNNNLKLTDELQKAKANALSDEVFKELEKSYTYKELFGNLDKLTVDKMIELRNRLEKEWSKLKLSPEQLEALRNKLEQVNNEIQTRNPFKALFDSINRYKKASDDTAKKSALKDSFESVGASLDIVKVGFDAVVNGLKDMGIAGDDVTQQLLGDISSMIGGAAELATGIASGNPLKIIQGSISLITSALKVFNFHDRKAEREIKAHAERVKQLEKSYESLERTVAKALGTDRYTAQKNAIENLKKQQKELSEMANAERSKKKSDNGKVAEYNEQARQAALKQEEVINKMRDDIMGTDAASAASTLGDAFIEAYSKGENAAEAYGKKVDSIVSGIIKKMLIQKLIEQPIGQIMNKYAKKWYDDKGNFLGFDAVAKDASAMGEEMKGVSTGFAAAMENLPEEIKKYFTLDAKEADKSLTGAVKGVSEDTASLVAGQMNAIRINQMEATAMLKVQLMHLAAIAQNTSYNYHLAKLERILFLLERSSDSMRSKGLG